MTNKMIKSLVFLLITISISLYYFLRPVPYTDLLHKSSLYQEYPKFNFNIDRNDVFSFVHIQKTGGTTFERHLVNNIINGNCECKDTKKPSCMCYRKDHSEIWLICRYIQPSWPCGLHPDFASLNECSPKLLADSYGVKKRNFYYGTLLRDPIQRFLSEFRHRQRGASWDGSSVLCKGKQFLEKNPKCHAGKIWLGLTLDEFLTCPYNLAINRQTWMLSNISKISCNFKNLIKKPKLSTKLLHYAKQNIENMAYFGLIEYPKESQFIFEKTFNLNFDEPFQLWDIGFAKVFMANVSDVMIQKIKEMNKLDIELYNFAKKIFFSRYRYFVNKYGAPSYEEPSATSKFAFKEMKKRRLKDNLPKSKNKEERLKKKINQEIERRQKLQNED